MPCERVLPHTPGTKAVQLRKQMNPRFLGIVREEHKVPVNRLRPVEAPVDSPHESSSIETPAKEALPRLETACAPTVGEANTVHE